MTEFANPQLATLFMSSTARIAPFVVGASALGLLLIGIRNSWETVTHIVVTGSGGDGAKAD